MAFSKETILDVGREIVIKDALPQKQKYEWVDIVGIPQRPVSIRNSLYFATHSDGTEGWDYGFDRRTTLNGVFRDKRWHFAVEEEPNFPGSFFLQVSSLEQLAAKLYEYQRSETKPFVVGVTGSVGKTTTVAFLEHIAGKAEIPVARFYSGRLSPLSVMCHYINRVNENTSLVVMEYSAYLAKHVSELAKLLPPDVAFLLNIYDNHINPGMFNNRQEILDSKLRIRQVKTQAFINKKVIDELGVPKPEGWSPFEAPPPLVRCKFLPPTIRTAETYATGKLFCDSLGIKTKTLDTAFESFQPKEDRIILCEFGKGLEIFFSGRTSVGGRLWSWFETFDGSCPWFFVEKLDFGPEDPKGFINLLEKVFRSDRTFVLDTPENREKLPVRAHYVSELKFGKLLREKTNSYVVYHKAQASKDRNFEPGKYLGARWGLG